MNNKPRHRKKTKPTKQAPKKRGLPDFASIGNTVEEIDVRLSYKIVTLFSEGLYASPNKAIEELVANSFDAGARRVAVLLPADFHEQGATIVVIDDGEGMDGS